VIMLNRVSLLRPLESSICWIESDVTMTARCGLPRLKAQFKDLMRALKEADARRDLTLAEVRSICSL
jgi:hypothetical protein